MVKQRKQCQNCLKRISTTKLRSHRRECKKKIKVHQDLCSQSSEKEIAIYNSRKSNHKCHLCTYSIDKKRRLTHHYLKVHQTQPPQISKYQKKPVNENRTQQIKRQIETYVEQPTFFQAIKEKMKMKIHQKVTQLYEQIGQAAFNKIVPTTLLGEIDKSIIIALDKPFEMYKRTPDSLLEEVWENLPLQYRPRLKSLVKYMKIKRLSISDLNEKQIIDQYIQDDSSALKIKTKKLLNWLRNQGIIQTKFTYEQKIRPKLTVDSLSITFKQICALFRFLSRLNIQLDEIQKAKIYLYLLLVTGGRSKQIETLDPRRKIQLLTESKNNEMGRLVLLPTQLRLRAIQLDIGVGFMKVQKLRRIIGMLEAPQLSKIQLRQFRKSFITHTHLANMKLKHGQGIHSAEKSRSFYNQDAVIISLRQIVTHFWLPFFDDFYPTKQQHEKLHKMLEFDVELEMNRRNLSYLQGKEYASLQFDVHSQIAPFIDFQKKRIAGLERILDHEQKYNMLELMRFQQYMLKRTEYDQLDGEQEYQYNLTKFKILYCFMKKGEEDYESLKEQWSKVT